MLVFDNSALEMAQRLREIKLLHTVIWAIMAGSILLLPVVGWLRKNSAAFALTVLILAECLVLAVNRCRCPLTDIAARYTNVRSDNFDIFLPEWLARYNKLIFGSLFVVGELIWLSRLRGPRA